MRILVLTIICIAIVQSSLAQQSWIDEAVPSQVNFVFFKSEGININPDKAQRESFNNIIRNILLYSGVHLSTYQTTVIEKILINRDINEKETVREIYHITGVVTVKGLEKVKEYNKIINNQTHVWYLYRMPINIKYRDVGSLAFVPTLAQFKRQENIKALGLIALETFFVVGGIAYDQEADKYHQDLIFLYSSNLIKYNQTLKNENDARSLSNLSLIGGSLLVYAISTLDGLSKNKSKPERVVRYNAYSSPLHSGITLSLALK